MKRQLSIGALAVGTLALTSLLQVAPAEAIVFGFQNISKNSVTDANIGEQQLQVDVTDDGNNGVNFRFENIGSEASRISEIYFDDGLQALTLPAHLTQGTGVLFQAGSASPGNLPAAGDATPDFNVTAGFLADSVRAAANGIDNKLSTDSANIEFLTLNYKLKTGISFNDLISAISNPDFDNSKDFRIGLHVISFASEGSESFITKPTAVPTPAAVLPALFGMGTAAIRKKKNASEVTQEA